MWPKKRKFRSSNELGRIRHTLRPKPRPEDVRDELETLWAAQQADLDEALARGDRATSARISAYLALICRSRAYWRTRVQAERRRPDVAPQPD